MELSYQQVDLEASEQAHRTQRPGDPWQPYAILTRDAADEWWVAFSALQFNSETDWRVTRRMQHVYIPLVPYLLPAEPSLAMGFMLQLAAGCFGGIGRRVQRLHIVTGRPLQELEQDGELFLRFYAGFAVVLEPG